MTKTWSLPRPSSHLKIFVACLVVLFTTLAVILFGVRLDATVSGSGVFEVRGRTAIHAPVSGKAMLGWYETDFVTRDRVSYPARLDSSGNGHVNRNGTFHEVVDFACSAELRLHSTKLNFHPLQSGDTVWPEQVVGIVMPEPLAEELKLLRSDFASKRSSANDVSDLLKRLDQIEARWAKARLLHAPKVGGLQVSTTPISQNQTIQAGAVLFYLDSKESSFIAQIDVPESDVGALREGQTTYLTCATHKVRLHGNVEARIEKVEQSIRQKANGERFLRVWAAIVDAPFDLRSGVSFEAKIIVGRKPVYRIILER